MLHNLYEFIVHPHSWRQVSLSEMGELYISMMIKSFAMSLVGIFVPVYMYQIGYNVTEILGYYAFLYALRILMDPPMAWIVGRFGPKHMMIASQGLLILQLLMFATLEVENWSLALIAAVHALGLSMFYVSYHIDFSKVQNVHHSGEQLGKMHRFVKLASAVGPLAGGAIATLGSVQIALYTAILLTVASNIPLLMSPEPVRTHQHVTWRGFPWRKVVYDLMSNAGLAADQMANLIVWPLYVSIFVFAENVYLGVGFVTSIGLAMSMIVTKAYGKLIDHRRGGLLLHYSVAAQSIAHLVRSLVSSAGAVFLFNVINEPIQVGIRMPYAKGVYDSASQYEGYRNAYISTIITTTNVMRTITMFIAMLIASAGYPQLALQSVFLLAAASIWLVSLERYRALR